MRGKCPRCGNIGTLITVSFKYPASCVEYDFCDLCCDDFKRFIEKVPLYNEHGYNLKEWEQRRECNEKLFFRGDLLQFQLENIDELTEEANNETN